MTPTMKDVLRAASLLAVLAAGSCASPNNTGNLMDDPSANHPIEVAPSFHTLRVGFSGSDAGLMPDDSAKFDAFVADYIQHGNGAISVSAPAGRDSSVAIEYFGERLAAYGIPREKILVGTKDSPDGKVEIGFIGYQASANGCGDWSADLSFTLDNQVSPNLGCAVQHNIAAQVADPRDLMTPRTMSAGDAARRATVYSNYRDGKPTGATHSTEQSGAVSDVGGSTGP
ncbi:MAG: CpaD family pilus assembly protein [Alphaproteobacteria bacterium]|nr:CpaD family pilus assembly protein [Alphaproteobacteria bacterium]MBL6937528.1 CpaD family pilus assembly protein [Alphaproteobacteria bacterium]MBL7098866.1 CpaD family pilus assembly protein [Alphaproteobacteria bacterium]